MRLEYYCQTCSMLLPQAEQPLKFCPRCGQNLTETPPWFVERKHHHDIRGVAKHQRRLIWCILIYIVITLIRCSGTMTIMFGAVGTPGGFPMGFLLLIVVSLGVMIYAIIEMILLMAALKWHPAGIVTFIIVYLLFGVLVSCISLVLLVVLNIVATMTLRAAGLRVGFFGVLSSDVDRLLDPYMCNRCGYNLEGNISGRCPECGTVTRLYPKAIKVPVHRPEGVSPHVTPPPTPPPGREQ